MITTTYLLLVAGLGGGLWWFTVRGRRRSAPAAGRWRALLVGITGDDDLVERMARSLVDRTTAFGTCHAVPGRLDAELPTGVFEAATAARDRLTAEVVHRYCELMTERARRLGRGEFALPADYALHLALSCGPDEVLTASFDPVRVPVGPTPVLRGAPDHHRPTVPARPPSRVDEVTARRVSRYGGDGGAVVLRVGGMPQAQRRLDARSPVLSVGRGEESALRCPDDLHDVSRAHAELTWVEGTYFVEDTHSANGTWLRGVDGEVRTLVPGEPTPWGSGDVLWLDEDGRVAVALL